MTLNFDRDPMADAESAECPGCHETFYAPKGHDPLKHHMQYCNEDYHIPLPDMVLEPRQTVYSREPGRLPACSYCGFPHDPDDPSGCGF